MSGRRSPEKKQADTHEKPVEATRFTFFPWKPVTYAVVPLGLLVVYLTLVAPRLVPVPPEVKVPFPALTAVLEDVCIWCGDHRANVVAIALGLLAGGMVFRITMARYYRILAVIAGLALVVSFLSISAPIDRLLKKVEASLPKDSRVPEHRAK